jgi:ATPase subunit of ABC transporter with duplicated ATPase domains
VYEAISGGADEVDLNGRKVNTRAYCSWYNFKSADQQKKVGVLSGVRGVRALMNVCDGVGLAAAV